VKDAVTELLRVLSSDAPKDLSKRKAGEAYIGAVVAALFEPYSSLLEVDGDKRNVFIGRITNESFEKGSLLFHVRLTSYSHYLAVLDN